MSSVLKLDAVVCKVAWLGRRRRHSTVLGRSRAGGVPGSAEAAAAARRRAAPTARPPPARPEPPPARAPLVPTARDDTHIHLDSRIHTVHTHPILTERTGILYVKSFEHIILSLA